jgi:hypothetical protein
MHRGFWHLITEDHNNHKNDEDRIVCMRRCERIRWVSHLISNINNSEISCWENKRGSDKNIVIWLESENYMIVLSKRKEYYLLLTAYPHNESKGRKNKREMSCSIDPRGF